MYTYLLPSYVLLPPKPGCGLARALAGAAEAGAEAGAASDHPFWAGGDAATPEEDLERKRVWRIDAELHAALRRAAAKYVGTHNFHNFTVGRHFSDRSNQRFVKKIEVKQRLVPSFGPC